ncbi:hypothetical protein K0W35_001193 [Vibrio parahaemolyticus]|nr:hypothetical protein [Vibrio parahaemolyticus]
MGRPREDTPHFVIDDLAQAVADGLSMLPKFPRRWLGKYGTLTTDTPKFAKSELTEREVFNKLKSEYLELLEEASQVEIKTTARDRYLGMPSHTVLADKLPN